MALNDLLKPSIKVYENSLVIINNYQALNDYTNQKIIIDKYEISGNNLIIKSMDEQMVKIDGEIKEIKFI
ncbi:MAG: YabP/YqfC family sporulation protein [Bacilli bacterium]|nr:YabP/YqfC family sporulation protein [Bacilli bacterium]MDY4052640.1 YabP/YqfC family sporulation protein [Bacilli bacterium]